ncbi:TOG array regulator of axonemal microtubules protein 1 [Cuculus canorus]|uniref:TOG array regulator of axonemal microtubules protein 1 n=1 Tax=Cuculus canorus TaxID=55661 RepID=UPI0023AA6971|nr:TOG array regulator of axonemal microtubules protein 1 [Cuculus canorus]
MRSWRWRPAAGDPLAEPLMAAALAVPPPAQAMQPSSSRGRAAALPWGWRGGLAWQEDEEEAGEAEEEEAVSSAARFGLLPAGLLARLRDRDYRGRAAAVQELKRAVGAASPAAVRSLPAPSLRGLLGLLRGLLRDRNFAVVLGALEAAQLLALYLGPRAHAVLGPLVATAVPALADGKAAVRREGGRLLLRVMEAAGPRQVLQLLLQPELLRRGGSRLREEAVNLCTAALLTYPGQELDLPELAFALAPALADGKRRVRHAAMEAFAVLGASMGDTGPLLEAVAAVEREEDGRGVLQGVLQAVQARLARNSLPKLAEGGLVEYAVPLACGPGRTACVPPGADTDWLWMGSRTRSAHGSCGCHARDGALQSACADRGVSPRRVLSAYKGKNKLPWESERAGDREGGVGVQMPFPKAMEQLSTSNDFFHSPKLRPSQGVPASDELFFGQKRASRNLFQNSVDFNSECSSVCVGAMGSHQPQISGKCGMLGYAQTRGKSGSVGSDLQLLGLNSSQQYKVCASLNFPSKIQRGFFNQAEHPMSFQGSNPSQGAFILPSYPLSSPRNSPKHGSSPADSPRKAQEDAPSFSSSWPLKSFGGLPKASSQPQLLSPQLGDNAGAVLQDKCFPLQLKPTVVRRPSSRRGLNGTRPVPPIPRLASPLPDRIELNLTKGRSEECEENWLWEAGRKLAADFSELKVDDEEVDQEEMQNSLRSLRSSAAKKRAKLSSVILDLESPDSALKLDLSVESPSHASSPSVGSCSESGVYSQESLTSPESTVPQRRRITPDTFPLLGSKLQPAGVSSGKSRDPTVAEDSANAAFDDEGTSDISVIGQRLNCGNRCGDDENEKQEVSPTVLKSQNMEHERSFNHSKGVFGSAPSVRACHQSDTCVANGDVQAFKEETELSPGICGRSIQQNSTSHLHAESEREIKVAMSKSALEKVRRKRGEEKEPNHNDNPEVKEHKEKEENPWERLQLNEPEKTATEKLDFCGDVLMSSRNVSLSLENMALNPALRRTSSWKKTKCSVLLDCDGISLGARGHYKERTPLVSHSPEILDPSELQPFSKPEVVLAEALAFLADDDWEKKIEGLNFVRCLSAYHATVLTGKLHETSLAVAQEVKNLRSGVSRAAVVCLGDLFTHLKKSMDQELDNAVKVLLHKAGESNTFIREEVDKALKAMVNNVTPARALCSLINGGQSHLHSAVRRCTAQHLSDIVERMGPERILSGPKAVADRIFPAIARFAQDSSQQTRYYGRKMLFSLMAHPDFDKTLEKYMPTRDLPYMKECVSNLREKGLGEMLLDTPSAKGRRSHTGSVGHSRSSSTSRDPLNITDRETTEGREVTKRTAPRNPLESEEYVKDMIGLLNAKDFRDRIAGIKQLLSDTENNQGIVVANLVKIFDAFKPRLHDSNSKVNQVALETMHKMIPLLKDNLSPVINMLIPAIVDNNLNSKNPGIYAAATNVIQALCQHLDNYLLLQPFCTKALFLNGKAKQDMTEKLADLVTELYPRKPTAVEQKVLTVLWHLLGNMTNSGSLPGAGGNIRAATTKLSKALFAQMGQSLLTHAAAQPPHIKKSLEEFLELAA